MTCPHPDYDDDDKCLTCGEYVQMYSDCTICGWFGIPIIDDGAPDTCNACLLSKYWVTLDAIQKANNPTMQTNSETIDERNKLRDRLSECMEDLEYFFSRQVYMEQAERRWKGQEEAA